MEETTVAQPAKSHKTLYIIIGVVVVVLLIGALFGRNVVPAMFAPGVSVDQNMDGTATYTTDEGSVTVGQGASLPSDWPSDAPKPLAGATILYSGTTNPTTGEAATAVAYNVKAPVKEVADYYTAQLSASGWVVEGNAQMSGMNVLTATKDTRSFGVYMGDAGDGTTNVTVGIQNQ